MSIEHKDITGANMHPPTNWSFANTAARTAAGSYVSGDVGKWAEQTDNGTLWRLVSFDGGGVPTWTQVGGSAGGSATYNNAWASPPSAPNAGDLWYPSDAPYTARYNGSAWDYYLPGMGKVTPPPTVANWAWVNQGTATATNANGYIALTYPGTSGTDSQRILERAKPGANFTITAVIRANPAFNGSPQIGIGLRNSSSGNLIFFRVLFATSAGMYVSQHASATAAGSNVLSAGMVGLYASGPFYVFQIQEDASNRYYRFGTSLTDLVQVYTEAKGTYITPDYCIFSTNAPNSGVNSVSMLMSWVEA